MIDADEPPDSQKRLETLARSPAYVTAKAHLRDEIEAEMYDMDHKDLEETPALLRPFAYLAYLASRLYGRRRFH